MTGSSNRWKRVGELFFAALEAEPATRETLLTELSDGDDALQAEVRELLAAHEAGGGFDRLSDEMGASPAPPPGSTEVGSRLGPYELVEEIGRGGMGAVFRARRADGLFEQEVALKLHRTDVYRDEMRERFHAERQILATISHPNIARLLDGGVDTDGRSYFAMEFVDGLPIDRYCDQHRLPIEERLRMFSDVCDAVQHAHRNLVVHRDLKPSNILVTADRTVKLLDFGIAKLLDAGDAGSVAAEVTRVGARLLTPEYASPEQILGASITTASDVYQLGVLLFELLVGTRPYRLAGASLLEIERVVTNAAIPLPSDAARRADADRPDPDERAAARATTVASLRRRLSGDLDRIVQMAMRREADRRYTSASDLADEIRRHLAGHPVRARPDGWWYRTSKFTRRNRSAVATVVALFALVSIFAVERGRQARETALALAQAEQVTAFLVSIFQSSSPDLTRGETLTVREVLDRGAQRVRTELNGEPEVRALLMGVIAEVYEHLALGDDAIELRRRALAARDSTLPSGHPDAVMAAVQLAQVLASDGDPDEARGMLEEAERRTRMARLTDVDRARHLNNIGYGWQVLGDLDRAEPLLERSIVLHRQFPIVDDARVGPLTNLGNIRLVRSDADSAEALFREGLEIRSSLVDGNAPEIATSLHSLARALTARGDFSAADSVAGEVLRIRTHVYEAGHPLVLAVHTLRAEILRDAGDPVAAESHYRSAIEGYAALLDPTDPRLAFARNDLASTLIDQGRAAEAEAPLRLALPVFERRYGDSHAFTAIVRANLAKAIAEAGRPAEADGLYEAALSAFRASGQRSLSVALTLLDQGTARTAARRPEAAVAPLTEAVGILLEELGPSSAEALRARNTLGATLSRLGRYEEAEAELLAAYEAAPEEYRSFTTGILVGLYQAWGRPEEARRFATGR